MKRMLTLLGLLLLAGAPGFAVLAPAMSAPVCSTSLAPAVPGEAPIFVSTCQVSKDCLCGNSVITISCTGNVSCTQQAGSITCDGHRYSCTMVDCNPQGPGGN
jgi:hypothetical protein